MTQYRQSLPQRDGGLFLTDAGLETDLIFNHDIDIREFAAHTLLSEPDGRHKMAGYFRSFLSLAREYDAGFVLDCPTWRAQLHWSDALGESAGELRQSNHEAVRFAAALRDEFADNERPIVLNGVIGPRGDAYTPETAISATEALDYHSFQLGWLEETDVDMVTALTFTQSSEAIGVVNAARQLGMPAAVSFTVETDGTLPTGQPLGEAIEEVDAATNGAPEYFMINCAHPDHFHDTLSGDSWLPRLRGLRCNASRRSHAELDEAEELDAGDPHELASQYRALVERMPWLNVLGGCCGSDLRHVTRIAAELRERQTAT